jgi:hypothetical protein
MIYQQIPLRLQLSIVSSPPVQPIDANTGTTPKIWRANTIAIALGLFDASNVGIDLTNLSYLQVSLWDSQSAPLPLVTKQINAGSITSPITIGAWNAGTAQNALAVFSSAETDQGLDGATEADFWLTVTGYTSGNAPLIYGAGTFTIVNAGAQLPVQAQGITALHKQTTTAGNATVTPTAPIHTEVVTVTGIARTSSILLAISAAQAGAKINLTLILPATAGIVLNIRSNLVGNPIISTVTTGTVLQALLTYYYDADLATWVPEFYALPPI